ncbi:unnamed protein product [Ceutorhynchus assimilis]|uniref:Uncharacterized protein n=1 Tax=Ceutorhynchus assimilis TaxID=467358 RepID=A0A9N9QPM3_9CUCU|nr:unnamed protein product [Ceutorhynchus assimilis]
MMKTGGGPENKIELDAADKILITIVNQKSVEGLMNIFDSDIADVQCKNVDEPKDDKGNNKQEFYLKNMTCLEKIKVTKTEGQSRWGFGTDNRSDTNKGIARAQGRGRQGLMTRQTRRPGIRILASSHIAQKYDELLDQRKLLLQKQIESINQDLTFQKIKNKLEIDILNIKLAREKQK